MKRFFMLLAAGLAALALAACNGTVPTLTFQQQVAIVCADSNTAVSILSADGVFTGGSANTLTKDVQPGIAKVCAAGATVTTANLQSLANASLPLLKSIVGTSNLSAQAKNEANAAIDLVTLAVNTAIALQPVAVPTAASGAVAASAPVAASQ